MNTDLLSTAIGAPLMLAAAGIFVYFTTRWLDRRDQKSAAPKQ